MWNGESGDFGSSDANAEENESEKGAMPEGDGNERHSFEHPKETKQYIQKSFHCLKDGCSIGYMDTDGVFLVTAGLKEPDIQVWDVASEQRVLLLSGHIGPVTGLELQTPSNKGASTEVDRECTVVSSSEDGTIRQWSVPKGEEVKLLTTANVLTCMGLLGRSLVITGNHKGYLEVYHLLTGQLYAREAAHKDPIDALLARDNYICTAVYPNSFKVWMMKWGKIVPILDLEDDDEMEFGCFSLRGEAAVLGERAAQRLHFVSLVTGRRQTRLLSDSQGRVERVEVREDLVFAATVDREGAVRLHVYEQHDFEHLLTFHCPSVEWVSSLLVLRDPNTLKFLIGGSSLAVLRLDFRAQDKREEEPRECKKKTTEGKDEMDTIKDESTSTKEPKLQRDTTTSISSLSKLNIDPFKMDRETMDTIDGIPSRRDSLSMRPSKLPQKQDAVQLKAYNTKDHLEKTSSRNNSKINLEKIVKDDSKITNKDPEPNKEQIKKIISDKNILGKEKDDGKLVTKKFSFRRNYKDPELESSQYSLPTIYLNEKKATIPENSKNDKQTVPQKSTKKFTKFAEKVDSKEAVNASGGKKGGGGFGEGVGTSQIDLGGGASGLERNPSTLSQMMDVFPEFVSDINDASGCLRNPFKKKKANQPRSSRGERKAKKKCSIM